MLDSMREQHLVPTYSSHRRPKLLRSQACCRSNAVCHSSCPVPRSKAEAPRIVVHMRLELQVELERIESADTAEDCIDQELAVGIAEPAHMALSLAVCQCLQSSGRDCWEINLLCRVIDLATNL